MSTEDQREVNCREVLERLEFYLDKELTEDDVARIRQHLADCPPCDQVLHIEELVKALVARSCVEHAPERLREQVLVRIREVQVRFTTD